MKNTIDPLNDRKSQIELLAHMGSDLDIVNDAKASFDRVSEKINEKDIRLITYLIENQHTSPFRGIVFKFKVKAPLFVCRQWWKHVVASNSIDEQLGWNEKSFRYVEIDDSSDFYIPQTFRQQATNNKQATVGVLSGEKSHEALEIYANQCRMSYAAYVRLIDLGVGREQARGILVPTVYTSWVWTVSLQALLHFIGLRRGKGAQQEIEVYAQAILELIREIVPETIKVWEAREHSSF